MYWGDHLFIEFLCSDNRSLKARRIKNLGEYVIDFVTCLCSFSFRAELSTARKTGKLTLANGKKLSLGWRHFINKHNVMKGRDKDKEMCRSFFILDDRTRLTYRDAVYTA